MAKHITTPMIKQIVPSVDGFILQALRGLDNRGLVPLYRGPEDGGGN